MNTKCRLRLEMKGKMVGYKLLSRFKKKGDI
jgi:hypothetical protein